MFSPKYYYRMKQKASKIEVTSTCKLLSIPSWIGIIGFGTSLIIIVFLFLLKSKLFPDEIYHIGCKTIEAEHKDGDVSVENTTAVEENCRTITLYRIITICLLVLSFVFLTLFCVAHYKSSKREDIEQLRSTEESANSSHKRSDRDLPDNIV